MSKHVCCICGVKAQYWYKGRHYCKPHYFAIDKGGKTA